MQNTVVKQNPLTFYLRVWLYMFIALMLRVVALSPLAVLFAFPAGSPWRYAALLCPVLYVFFIGPLSFSFADALVQRPRCRAFSFDRALSLKGYGEKLMESLLHALSVLKWAIPLLALGGYAYYCKDSVDAKTLMASLINMGKTAGDIWYGTANFFVTLFGHQPMTPVAGSLMQGLYVVLGVVGLAALVLIYGMVRNSATRYIWVIASRGERPVRTEIRRRLRGRRWRQLLTGLGNLVLWSPFLAVVGLSLKDVVADAATQLMLSMGSPTGSALDVSGALTPLFAAFLFLYMPLLPARRILTAAFATRDIRHTAPKKTEPAAAQPATGEGMPSAIVPDWVKAENQTPPDVPVMPASFTEPAAPVAEAPDLSDEADPSAQNGLNA